jgi:hypothetical protein
MMKRSLFLFLMFISLAAEAQELRCNIQISSQQIQGTNKQVFQTLQGAVNVYQRPGMDRI